MERFISKNNKTSLPFGVGFIFLHFLTKTIDNT
nr:MAG TPA: hypothetical protein [Caudoviricetes sp.]DAT25536.1 MAG TPA: hypothetical protein [Caudoviricetes sp.]